MKQSKIENIKSNIGEFFSKFSKADLNDKIDNPIYKYNSKDENVSPYFIEIKHYEDAQHNTLDKEMTFEDYLNSIVKDNNSLPLGSIILNDHISEKTL